MAEHRHQVAPSDDAKATAIAIAFELLKMHPNTGTQGADVETLLRHRADLIGDLAERMTREGGEGD